MLFFFLLDQLKLFCRLFFNLSLGADKVGLYFHVNINLISGKGFLFGKWGKEGQEGQDKQNKTLPPANGKRQVRILDSSLDSVYLFLHV